MFTGIVEDIGTVAGVRRSGEIVELTISTSIDLQESKKGDSIAVSGVCLTCVSLTSGRFAVQVAPATLKATTLGRLRRGGQVNLERALRLEDRLDGHFVLGHVDGVARVDGVRPQGDSTWIRFSGPEEITRYIVPKGSVAIDGVSLTVANCQGDAFEVSLIPHTLAATTIGKIAPGEEVNVECDILGKYIEKFVRPYSGAEPGGESDGGKGRGDGIDKGFLAEHGFLSK